MRVLNSMILILLMPMIVACQSTVRTEGPKDYETIQVDPNRETEAARRFNAEALDKIEAGEFVEAESILKKALAADIMYGPAHNNLGRVYYAQERYYLAAWEFEYAVKLMPNQVEPKNNLGLVFERVGKYDDAVKHYDEAVSIEPDNPILLGNLVRARLQRGDKDTEVRQLLVEIILKDHRAEWRQWAERKLALMGGPDGTGEPEPFRGPGTKRQSGERHDE